MKIVRLSVVALLLALLAWLGVRLLEAGPRTAGELGRVEPERAEVGLVDGALTSRPALVGEVEASARVVPRLPDATVQFSTDGGAPIAGVRLGELVEGEDFLHHGAAPTDWIADGDGLAKVTFDVPEPKRLSVSLGGYVTTWVELRPGEHRVVTLMAAFGQRFHAKTESGEPVAGVRIAVATHSLPVEVPGVWVSGVRRPGGADLPSDCAIATTDVAGVALVEGLQAGRDYFITIDLQGMPYQVANLGDCVMSRPPYKDVHVRLRRVLAAVVEADRGAVLKVALDSRNGPFVGGLTVLETCSVDEVKARLRARFPDALVFAGAEAPGGARNLKLSMLDRSGVVQETEVALRLPGEIEAPTLFRHAWSGRVESAEVQFEYVLPDGVATRHGPPFVVVKQVDGRVFQWTAHAGGRVEVPRGPLHVRWGEGIIGDKLSPVEVDVVGNGVVRIPLSRQVFAYPLRVVDRNGVAPRVAGCVVRVKTASGRSMTTSLTLVKGSMDIWSFEPTLSCTVRLEGHKVLRVVVPGQVDGSVEHVIAMESAGG